MPIVSPDEILMTALRCIILVALCGLTLRPDLAPAQVRTTIAVDATLGAGFGKGGEFFDRNLTGGRIAASVRRSGPTARGFFGELALDALSLSSGHFAICYSSPRAPCSGPYPELWGPTITGGLIAQPSDRFEARVGVGVGAYVADGTRVGAALSQFDVAVFP